MHRYGNNFIIDDEGNIYYILHGDHRTNAEIIANSNISKYNKHDKGTINNYCQLYNWVSIHSNGVHIFMKRKEGLNNKQINTIEREFVIGNISEYCKERIYFKHNIYKGVI